MWLMGRKGQSGFSSYSTAEEVTQGIDASGLTAIVTGASSGIGAETARVLALRGVRVIMAVRNMDAGRNVKEAILEETPDAKVDVMKLDLSSMDSVRKFASEYTSRGLPLNILINNAGVLLSPSSLNEDNIELQFATNYLGHFLLTNLLLKIMKNTAKESNKEGRIINVSSLGHRFVTGKGICFDEINNATSWYAYGQSKLANILHAKELARRLKEENVQITANALHPGVIHTNLVRRQGILNGILNMVGKYLVKDVHQGAATTCYIALHPQVKGVSGKYFSNCNIVEASSLAKDAELAKKLWDFSLSITGLWQPELKSYK
ncbi:Short-chain dehydrogenase TIC 32, chloroplastic [Turnera subulata]|uniref:Short-chain dehydrogenase TIC 32, chloroplastic n=1 Tax=Turnera subulata TaxID=218843 RepID=A0A9Q0FI49_9ROSI|nr:Short-chain dehydrogenase TIC 32, chloroplastic [Turnera subulata]